MSMISPGRYPAIGKKHLLAVFLIASQESMETKWYLHGVCFLCLKLLCLFPPHPFLDLLFWYKCSWIQESMLWTGNRKCLQCYEC